MLLGVELVAATVLFLSRTDGFSLSLWHGDSPVAGSPGHDTFDFDPVFLTGHRVAASGRAACLQLAAAAVWMPTVDVAPAIAAPVSPGRPLQLQALIRSSALVNPALFCHCFQVRLVDDRARPAAEFSLRHRAVTLDWRGRGRFRFDITALMPRRKDHLGPG